MFAETVVVDGKTLPRFRFMGVMTLADSSPAV
jgi:hypothetical protein